MGSLQNANPKLGELSEEVDSSPRVAVIIPAYKVRSTIVQVVQRIGPEVASIIVVDDSCVEDSGTFLRSQCSDPRLQILQLKENQGVGGATIEGYCRALEIGASIAVKVDGDGQMDPSLIPQLIEPLISGRADYCKGNRFFFWESSQGMPCVRLLGNLALSFVNKASSGYWNLMDPTNGFTAIQCSVLKILPLSAIERRFFFESDLLFHLNCVRARVLEVPISSQYGEEQSNLSEWHSLITFPFLHLRNLFKRIFTVYFVRDFNLCSLAIVLSFLSLAFGVTFGSVAWRQSIASGVTASSGTVMLAALPILIGIQLAIAAVSFDVANTPKEPIFQKIRLWSKRQKF